MSSDGQDRVLRAIEFKSVDRAPVAGGFVRHPRFLAATAGVTLDQFWSAPRATAIAAFHHLGVDLILALILPSEDSDTCAQIRHHDKQTEFKSPECVRDHAATRPRQTSDPACDRQERMRAYQAEVTRGQAECGAALWIPNGIHRYCPVFDYCARFGYENYVMALTLYPEAMEPLFAHDAERAFRNNCAVAEVTAKHNLVPIVWTGTDACDNRGPFVDPDIMREIYFPHLKHALRPLREAGIKILWHADGFISPIAADLLEAGVDGFQGLQEMIEPRIDIDEIDSLRTLDGCPPLFVGSISSTVTMPFGTPEDVRAEVARWRNFAAQRRGGVILNFSSSLGPEVPEENIRTFFREATRPAKERPRGTPK